MGTARRSVVTHRKPLGLLAILACLLLLPQTVEAFTLTGAAAEALKLLIGLLSWVVETLGKLFVYLVDIFLGFARYNKFGDAQPVKIGWVIVRDICNMFFIVVLLISAFNTIIGWDSSLRYNQVLPKLLLMAILINFSRTLVQVLIDFSQVVMLTFVNAFQAAGAGNFAAAFRINDLLSMRDNFASQGQQAVDAAGNDNYDLAAQLFTSFLLALILIVIANGVMLIMIIYILARIIGLWIALIFSPLAFFVKALPSSLQSGLSSFSGKYWSRLSGMLTGGPVVMFFIYLTFAILQTAPANPPANPGGQTAGGSSLLGAQGSGLSNQLELYTPTTEINSATNFLTRVGTSDNVASFIVAVALMLMALEAAIEAANAVEGSVGKIASTIGSASKGLAFGAAALAASSPWLATKLGYRTLDKRYDMTGKASTAGLWLANKVPIAGQFARPVLMKGMMMRRKEREAERQELNSAQSGMTTNERRLVQAGLQSTVGAVVGNAATRLAGAPGRLADKVTGDSLLSRAARATLKGTGKVTEGANKALGGAWFTQGDRLARMDIANYLTSEAARAEDQRNIEDEIEEMVNNDPTKSDAAGWTQSQRDNHADNLVQETIRRNMARQYQISDEVAKSSPIRAHDVISRNKAERNKDPLLWGSKLPSKMKSMVENMSKLKGVDAVAAMDGQFLAQFMETSGMATVEQGLLTMSTDKARNDKIIAEVRKNNALLADSLEFARREWSNMEQKDDQGVERNGIRTENAYTKRIETDANGDMHFMQNDRGGTSVGGRIAKTLEPLLGQLPVGQAVPLETKIGPIGNYGYKEFSAKVEGPDKRVYRNTNQAKALAELKVMTATDLAADAGADAFGRFQAAEGDVSDLASIPGFEKAVEAFAKKQADALTSVLERGTEGELKVQSGQESAYQDIVKNLRFLKQIDSAGFGVENFSGKVVQPMLRALNDAKMNVGGSDYAVSDIFAFKATSNAIKDLETKKVPLHFYSAAQRAAGPEAAAILAKVNEFNNNPNSKVRSLVNPEAVRAINLGLS